MGCILFKVSLRCAHGAALTWGGGGLKSAIEHRTTSASGSGMGASASTRSSWETGITACNRGPIPALVARLKP